MNNLRFVCAQPAIWYYHWQIDVMLHNFKKNNIPLHNVHCVMATDTSYDQSLWQQLANKYPEVTFRFYEDTRTDKRYIPSVQPHILHKHFSQYPELYSGPVFFHDCDIVLTRPLDVTELLADDIWYLSDTRGYIGSEYIKSKGLNILKEMCEVIGIDETIVSANEYNSGGAQYLMKDIPENFWLTAELGMLDLYNYFTNKSTEYVNLTAYHPIQSWTAGMWVILWNIWKNNRTTVISKSLDFCWPTDPISKWNDAPIYHNAGVTTHTPGDMFFKANYTRTPPKGLSLNDFTPSKCSYNYVREIIETLG